jgi:hypothetical protein
MQEKQFNSKSNNDWWINALIYGFFKSSSAIAGYPVDAARSRMYTGISGLSGSAHQIYDKEGLRGFYSRGFGSSVVRMGTKEAYRGGFYESFGHGLLASFANSGLDTVLMPLDQVKIVQQTADEQRKFLDVTKQVVRSGPKEMYKGCGFYFSRQFGAHYAMVTLQGIADDALKNKIYKNMEVPLWAGFCGSLGAGFCVATLLNPFNRVITQLQSGMTHNQRPLEIMTNLVKTEGFKGLVKGSSATYIMGAIGQLTYFGSKYTCAKIASNNEKNSFVAKQEDRALGTKNQR